MVFAENTEEGISVNTTTAVYTDASSVTAKDHYVTHVTASESFSDKFTYYIGTEAYTLSEEGDLTISDCPCTYADQSQISTVITQTSYSDDYFETVNATTNPYRSMTGFIQDEGKSSSKSINTVSDNFAANTKPLFAGQKGLSNVYLLAGTLIVMVSGVCAF